ncbi:MAG: hypothetical protein SWQ30_05155 [Thermodesulfobacteriota bacterium]|nr:hypothetical protein [Thermodesulfobacteriota bacterium]
MPTSPLHQLNDIMELIILTNPGTILDIGVGFGKYGFLAREYLELWDDIREYRHWKRRIDGIEIHSAYITPVHDFVYDHVYDGNAIDIVPTLEVNYDLVLVIDILEHFEYEDGLRLLDVITSCGRNTIIATPKYFWSQEDAFGNPFETHRSLWRKRDFSKYANRFFVYNEETLICYIGEDAPRLRLKGVELSLRKNLGFLRFPYRIIKKMRNR